MAEKGGLKIKSYEQASVLIREIISGEQSFYDSDISIDESLGGIVIRLTGDKFNSTITTGIMGGLVNLQKALYDGYSLVQYGKIQKLSAMEKEILELSVRVDAGSSILEILINSVIKVIGKKMDKLTSKEIINIIKILTLAVAGCILGGKHIDAKKAIKSIEAQGKIVTETQKNTIYAIEKMQDGGRDFNRALSKQNFDFLEINGQEVTHEDLQEWIKTTREKKPLENKVYKGQFFITDIHFENDTIYIDVVSDNSQLSIKYINILAELVSEDDYQWFKDSINRQSIDMTIVSTEKQGKIIAAYLQSFKK